MSGAIRLPETRAKAAEQLANRYMALWKQARGRTELEVRATASYEHWVGSEGVSLRARDDAQRLGDVVKFHQDAVTNEDETAAAGLNVLVLAADGRVQRMYTFVDGA